MVWSVSGGSKYTSSESNTRSSSEGSESSTTSTRRLSDGQVAELSRTMSRLQRDVDQFDKAYSKQAAIQDSKGLVADIFKQYRETDLPNILQAQSNAGAYSNTGSQLLANDAFARTTSAASSAVLQAIQSYAGIQAERRNVSSQALSTVLSGLLAAREDTTASSMFNTSSKSKTKATTQQHAIKTSYTGYN